MQAMNGSGGLGIQRLCRLIGCVAALAALAAMVVPSIAAAKPPKVKKTYLALGDSLAFGYSQQLFNENEATGENPAAFEHGYASDYYKEIAAGGKVQFVNDGCPGETTESLIGDNPTLLSAINGAVAGKTPDAVTGEEPCAYHTADHLALHHEYGGTKSQLESALETIATDKAAGRPVKDITLDIGANDELHAIAKAEREATAIVTKKVTEEAEAQAKTDIFDKLKAIAEKEVETYVIEQVEGQAYEETGGEKPAFEERIAVLAGEYGAAHHAELAAKVGEDIGIYSEEHAAELAAEGQKIAEEAGAKYEAEHGAELKAEGEAIVLGKIHTEAHAIFEQIASNIDGIFTAIRDAGNLGLGDNYNGKITFVGTYNTYGNDYGTGELLPGANQMLRELSATEKALIGKRPIKACFVAEQTLFNTENAEEPLHMSGDGNLAQSWTNMGNFTEYEHKKNGPDIHATPLGYEKMAEYIHSNCSF
jgi:lysophospholipase L1-like esterase